MISKWMEFLRLRSTGVPEEDFLKRVTKFESELEDTGGLVDWLVYRHATLRGDCTVILHWDTEQLDPMGSTLAQALTRELSQLGMVDHSVWLAESTFTGRNEP